MYWLSEMFLRIKFPKVYLYVRERWVKEAGTLVGLSFLEERCKILTCVEAEYVE